MAVGVTVLFELLDANLSGELKGNVTAARVSQRRVTLFDFRLGLLESDELEAALLFGVFAVDGGQRDARLFALFHGLRDRHGNHRVSALGLQNPSYE